MRIEPAPRQLGLPVRGLESPLDRAWAKHAQALAPMTLDEALAHPMYGKVIRCHAATLAAMDRRKTRRRGRRA